MRRRGGSRKRVVEICISESVVMGGASGTGCWGRDLLPYGIRTDLSHWTGVGTMAGLKKYTITNRNKRGQWNLS